MLVEAVTGDGTLDDDSFFGAGTDALSWIERAEITGDSGPNTLNAAAFTGPVTLNGGGGNDTLFGGSGNDALNGGTENDMLDGNGGDDALIGGTGIDTVDEEGDTDFTLTNTSLAAGLFSGLGKDSLNEIEEADLAGGTGATP